MTRRAAELTRNAVATAADAITLQRKDLFEKVRKCELALDTIDREFDEDIVFAVTGTTIAEGRILLCCFKFIIDLERIGDLVHSFSSRAEAIGRHVGEQDLEKFIQMLSVLEHMVKASWEAFEQRNIDLALKVVRHDSEIDRLRNLVFLRHVGEQRDNEILRDSVQVLFMAHALERAGDHAKNLGEEVCHFISGRTLRHVLRDNDKSYEQLFLARLREKSSGI
jgi:phosphate transport system protein